MSALIRNECVALASVEKARALLAECRSTREVRHIRALAQAVATAERGKEIALDAAEIILNADVRIGELTREMQHAPHAKGAGKGHWAVRASDSPKKSDQLAAEGLTKQQASVCEKVASLPKPQLDAYVKACREAKEPPTTAGAVSLAKLSGPTREKVIAKLGDVPSVRAAIAQVKPRVQPKPPPTATDHPWNEQDALVDVRDALAEFTRQWEERGGSYAELLRAARVWANELEHREAKRHGT